MQVIALAGNHDRLGFDCGRQELNDWLRQGDRQRQDNRPSKTFIGFRDAEPARICSDYARPLAELENRHLPDARRKKGRRTALPACAWADWRLTGNTRARSSANCF